MGVATACLVALVAGAGLEACCGGFCVVAVVVCWCSCIVMMFLVHVFMSIVHLWGSLPKEKSGSLPKERCIILELNRKFKLKLPVCANIYSLHFNHTRSVWIF
jgi:hypothetical protein